MGAGQDRHARREPVPCGLHRLMMWRHRATSCSAALLPPLTHAMASRLSARDAADEILRDLKSSVSGHLTVSAVGLFMAIALSLIHI